MLAEVDIAVFPDGRMTPENTAKYTGYSVKTLAIIRSTGQGPRFVKHGRVFYYKEDVDAWLSCWARVFTTREARQPRPVKGRRAGNTGKRVVQNPDSGRGRQGVRRNAPARRR
jgi:hypothetical protein